MATPDPKATIATPVKPPAAPAPIATPVKPPAAPAPIATPDSELDNKAPIVETINISGLVMEKTVAPDGECKTRVIRQPMIAGEQIRATKASQRERGH